MVISSKKVWLSGQFRPTQIVVRNGLIEAVCEYGKHEVDYDMGEMRVVPGFIDQHTHGGYGYDSTDGTADGLRQWLKNAPNEGITALLPTTVTQSEEVLTAALKTIAKVADNSYSGAEILGVHLEGPYISQDFKGAQPEAHILPADIQQFKRYQEAANGHIKLITLAPEVDEDHSLSRYCSQNGVAVNMGHTNATYEQAMLAFENGVSGVTHMYNAMSRFTHREPGAVGAALASNSAFTELIPDGVHCHFGAAEVLFKSKPVGKVVVVTDSLLIKGADRQSYTFGGQTIAMGEDGGAAVLENSPETLAGSVLKYNMGLRNLVEKAGVPFVAAIDACTINPAERLGFSHKKGRIYAGYDADITVLDDEYNVVCTWCRGIKVR